MDFWLCYKRNSSYLTGQTNHLFLMDCSSQKMPKFLPLLTKSEVRWWVYGFIQSFNHHYFLLVPWLHVTNCIYFQRTGHDVCGPATFTASRETSQKSRAKVDEEGLEIAVCRHGVLLRGLNHYRGEIYAYPMFLQKELAQAANTTFFCMDITCR